MIPGLLDDECAKVREAVIPRISRVLAFFWPILPISVIKATLTTMTSKLAFDKSSPRVRAASIRGLSDLIAKCEQSHIVMRHFLPKIGNCVHDVNEQVRSAVVDLLIGVKKVKSIPFWDVCGLEDILSRFVLLIHASFSEARVC